MPNGLPVKITSPSGQEKVIYISDPRDAFCRAYNSHNGSHAEPLPDSPGDIEGELSS